MQFLPLNPAKRSPFGLLGLFARFLKTFTFYHRFFVFSICFCEKFQKSFSTAKR